MCSYRSYFYLICLCLCFFYYKNLFSSNRTHDLIKSQSSTSIHVMYVIRTNSQFYQKRLIYQLQTWISLVSNDVFFVSNRLLPNISSNHILSTEQTCGPDAHTMNGLCCKTAHDFLLYQRHLLRYQWFCHFDDDQYVNTNNLNEYLSTYDHTKEYYIGKNSWAGPLHRTKEPYPSPFWFATLGAGVCLSQRTVTRLLGLISNVSEFADGCIRENYHDDIYLGFLLNNYLNITLTKCQRFHSHLEKDFYENRAEFLRIFVREITFGFRLPDRYPYFLPDLYRKQIDPFRMRTLHCLLYPEIKQCRTKINKYFFNATN